MISQIICDKCKKNLTEFEYIHHDLETMFQLCNVCLIDYNNQNFTELLHKIRYFNPEYK